MNFRHSRIERRINFSIFAFNVCGLSISARGAMGFARVFLIAGSLMIVSVMFDILPGTLPHPACHHHVVEIQSFKKPGSLNGDYAPNTALQSARRLLEGAVNSSESIAVSPSGKRLFMGDKYGRIFTAQLTTQDGDVTVKLEDPQPSARVRGRPLGIHAMTEDRLLICDSVVGLVDIDLGNQTQTILSQRAETSLRDRKTSKVVYANDLDVDSNGIVYFSDSTDIPVDKCNEGYYSTLRSYMLNVFEGRPTGRLLAYDPVANATKELMHQLWYANGVAVSKDESFVAVVETNQFRVWRYWMKGPFAKTKEILIEGLPGLADGISTAPDGGLWIALVAPPLPLWRLLKFKVLRWGMAWATEYMTLPFKRWGYLVKVSPHGKVLQVLSDTQGGFIRGVSSIVERDGMLFMGNLFEDYIAVFDLGLLTQRDEGRSKDEL